MAVVAKNKSFFLIFKVYGFFSAYSHGFQLRRGWREIKSHVHKVPQSRSKNIGYYRTIKIIYSFPTLFV
jgi:hypothetical protein